MSKFKYTEANEERVARIAKKYPKIDAMMLPALWLVQEQEGWVSPDAMIFVADKLRTKHQLKFMSLQHSIQCST
ncbi:MAG: NAD(P)H-dependent oxidoreductase subunit E [Halarcobacter sp.]